VVERATLSELSAGPAGQGGVAGNGRQVSSAGTEGRQGGDEGDADSGIGPHSNDGGESTRYFISLTNATSEDERARGNTAAESCWGGCYRDHEAVAQTNSKLE
jgi:hypothetical protein